MMGVDIVTHGRKFSPWPEGKCHRLLGAWMTHSNLPDRTLECFPVPSQVRRVQVWRAAEEALRGTVSHQECVFQDVRRHSSAEQGYRSTTISLEGAAVL